MPLYDLFLLLDPGAPTDRHETILSDVRSLLESDGKLVGAHDWGSRRMTFEIDHRPDAAYHLFQFEAESGGALLNRVDHALKITDGVLRHRIIRLKDGSPPPPMPRQEGRPYGAEAAEAAPGSADGAPADVAAADARPAPAEPAETAAPDASSLPAEPDAPAEAPAADAPAAEPAATEPAATEAPAEPAATEPAEPAAEPVPGDSEAESQA